MIEHVRRARVELLAVALVAAALVEVMIGSVEGPREAVIPATLGWSLPFLLARRLPLAAGLLPPAAVLGEAFAVYEATETSVVLLVAIVCAFWVLGSLGAVRSAVLAGLAGVGLLMGLVVAAPTAAAGDVIFVLLVTSAPWLSARAVKRLGDRASELQGLADRLAGEREARVAAAAAQERARIARDLHDVIADGIEAMVVQAGAARILVRQQPELAREAALATEETGRASLAEMRRLLGVLRQPESSLELEPLPGVAAVETLCRRVTATSLPVALTVEGDERRLPVGLDLAAYRIVEKALELAAGHDGVTAAAVALRWSDDMLELVVADDGRSAVGSRRGQAGAELAAMRVWLEPFGGAVDAGRGDDGGCQVTARLPTGALER